MNNANAIQLPAHISRTASEDADIAAIFHKSERQRREYSERERAAAQAEEARKRRLHRKQLRDFKVFCLGIAATCCGIIAFGVWYAGLRPLAFFPAALALIAIHTAFRQR